MYVSCLRSVLSGRGLCVELITRPEGSYKLWSAVGTRDFLHTNLDRPWGPPSLLYMGYRDSAPEVKRPVRGRGSDWVDILLPPLPSWNVTGRIYLFNEEVGSSDNASAHMSISNLDWDTDFPD